MHRFFQKLILSDDGKKMLNKSDDFRKIGLDLLIGDSQFKIKKEYKSEFEQKIKDKYIGEKYYDVYN